MYLLGKVYGLSYKDFGKMPYSLIWSYYHWAEYDVQMSLFYAQLGRVV